MTGIQQGSDASTVLTKATGQWVLDPTATTLAFTTKAMWVLPVKGTFTAIDGTATVTPDGVVSGSLTIDAASVKTGTAKRDNHLLTADFFDVARFPTLRYDVTSVTVHGSELQFSGSFTAHGQTHPLVLTGTATSVAGRLTVVAEGDLDRTGWGLTWAKMGAGIQNHLLITAVFTRV